MSLFKKIFGNKKPETVAPPRRDAPATPGVDPTKDPNMMKVFDGYGRECFISRQEWRTRVLPANLQQAWNDPDQLYNMVVSALRDDFRPEVVAAAGHLAQIDSHPFRGACIWGIVLLGERRLDEADAVFREVTARHGEDGVIFTNWAKVYAQRGDHAKSEELLWHALQLDPNQDNGVGWYEVIYRERGGKEAGQEALRRIAALPGSWRARLWLARTALQDRQLDVAMAWYEQALTISLRPVPHDFLMQMSGDLGNNAHLPELVRLCEPHFDPSFHGLQVGNNLIKAHVDLGQFEDASRILNQLYAQKRPDWQQTLSYWDNAIAQARVEITNPLPQNPQVSMLVLMEPIWLREGSPALRLFNPKAPDSPVIALLSGSAETGATKEVHQLSNTAGRLSRALPLFFSEQLHLTSTAVSKLLIPLITSPSRGFLLTGVPCPADQASGFARESGTVADYVITFHFTAIEEPWKVEATLCRTIDHAELGSARASFASSQPETAFRYLLQELRPILEREAGLQPASNPLYAVPAGTDFPFYLLRLEQALAVSASLMNPEEKSFLSGERDIILGNIQLNLNQPQNTNVRLLLAQTLKQLKKIRPDIVPEFREKITLLQKEKPLPLPAAQAAAQALFDEAFSD